jgi:hypothetical protein
LINQYSTKLENVYFFLRSVLPEQMLPISKAMPASLKKEGTRITPSKSRLHFFVTRYDGA